MPMQVVTNEVAVKRDMREMLGRPIRVLLAEDHALVRRGLRSILDASGDVTVVAEAINGQDALSQARSAPADVAILDIAMPIMNGIATARQLRVEFPTMGIIMLSMHTSRQYIFEALRTGVLGYLFKDAALDDLLLAVREVHAGRRYLAPQVSSIVLEDYIDRGGVQGSPPGVEQLSGREREVLQLLAEGKTSAEVATILSISPHTVDTHRRNMMTKLDLKNVVELVKFAIRSGLVSIDD